MKHLLVLAAVVLLSVSAAAEEGFKLGFWFDAPRNIAQTEVKGLRLGLPVSAGRLCEGAELSLIGSTSKNMQGFQYAWIGFTSADVLNGCQLAFVNLISRNTRKFAMQIGFYNQCAKGGFQIGWINTNSDNARLQIGLVNINANGWLPFMVFFNMARRAQ